MAAPSTVGRALQTIIQRHPARVGRQGFDHYEIERQRIRLTQFGIKLLGVTCLFGRHL